jgi:hypothetical protein
MPVGVGKLQNKWSHLILHASEGQGSPFGQELLVPHKGISALFTGLGPVLIAKGLQLGLHGLEHWVVLVHRFLAT